MKPSRASLALLLAGSLVSGHLHAAAGASPGLSAAASVPQPRPRIRVEPATCVFSHGCYLHATVTDDSNQPLAGVPIAFYLNGHKLLNARNTDAAGKIIGYSTFWDAVNHLGIPLHSGLNQFSARVDNVASGVPWADGVVQTTGALTVKAAQPKVDLSGSQSPLPPVPTANGNQLKVEVFIAWLPPNPKIEVTFGNFSQTYTESPFWATIPLKPSDLGQTRQLTVKYLGHDLALPTMVTKTVHLEGVLPASPWAYSVQGVSALSPSVRVGETVGIKVHIHANDTTANPVANAPFKVIAGGPYALPKDQLQLGSGVTDAQGNGIVHYTHKAQVKPQTYPLTVLYDNAGHGYVTNVAPGPNDARGNLRVAPTEIAIQFLEIPRAATHDETVRIKFRASRRHDQVPTKIRVQLVSETGGSVAVADAGSSTETDQQGIGSLTFKVSSDKQLSSQDFYLRDWENPAWFDLHHRFSIPLHGRTAGAVQPGIL